MTPRTLDALRSAVGRRSVAVIVERFGVFVAIRSRKHNGALEIPGGKVEPGESTYEAARREAEEEVGVPVRILPGAVGEFRHTFRGEEWCATIYAGDLDGAHPREGDDGPATWATREELLASTYGDALRVVFPAYDAWKAERATAALTAARAVEAGE